ncbi:hypothetical protein [Kocuria rosea]|uniref:hypothetical protein n=1 Tax=Kocuria rosea TaxID=1275 RepID=UPI002041E226|nr:hypothetical protein [Kocuria rosea]
MEDPSSEVATFGQAWDRIEAGEDCTYRPGEYYAFVWDENDEGGLILAPAFQEAVEAVYGKDLPADGEEGDAADLVDQSVDRCLTRFEASAVDESSDEDVQQYALTQQLCPGHPNPVNGMA